MFPLIGLVWMIFLKQLLCLGETERVEYIINKSSTRKEKHTSQQLALKRQYGVWGKGAG